MRRAIFLVPFSVVAAAVLSAPASLLFALAGLKPNLGQWYQILHRFSNPIPSLLGMFIPFMGQLLVTLVFAALVTRRLYLFAKARSLEVPAAYSGVPMWLLSLSLVSMAAAVVAFVVVAYAEPRQGIIALRILNPAMLLAPLAVAWGELKSLGSSRAKAVS